MKAKAYVVIKARDGVIEDTVVKTDEQAAIKEFESHTSCSWEECQKDREVLGDTFDLCDIREKDIDVTVLLNSN